MGSLHIVELPPPLHPSSDHQIPNVEILEALPLLLSVGLDVTKRGIGLEGVSPLMGILLLVEWKGLLLIFQRSREARRARDESMSTRTRSWDLRNSVLSMGSGDGGRLAIDSAEVLVDHQRRIVKGHDNFGVGGSAGGSG